jgi:serine/threonine-protein kinase
MVILGDGALIGRYRVRSLLFRTALFDAYSAIDARGVAVCALRCEHGGRPIPADSELEAEIKKLRGLRASRFPRVLDGGRDDRSAWLVTEAIGGTSPIWTPGADPVHWFRALMTLGRSVAASFGEAAEAGIYHGALTPDCLRKWPNGAACIVGVGAARLFGLDTETLRASPRYCAPEQFQEAAIPTSERTDVYALGMCLYALLLGREPFDGATALELRSLAEHGSPDFSLLRRQPDKLTELLARCCAKGPVDRFDWAGFTEWVNITISLCQYEVPEATQVQVLTEIVNQLDRETHGALLRRSSQIAAQRARADAGAGDSEDEDEEADSTEEPASGDPASSDEGDEGDAGDAGDEGGAAEGTDRTPPAGEVALLLAGPPKEPSNDVAAESPEPPPLEAPAAPPLHERRSRGRASSAVAMGGGVCLCLGVALVMMSNSGPPAPSPPPARPALIPGPGPLSIDERAAEEPPPSAEPAPRVSRPAPAMARGAGGSLRGSCGTWFYCEPMSEEVK